MILRILRILNTECSTELVEELEAGLELDLLTIFSSSDWFKVPMLVKMMLCNLEVQPLADCITRSELKLSS
jgi:hypothetical protein